MFNFVSKTYITKVPDHYNIKFLVCQKSKNIFAINIFYKIFTLKSFNEIILEILRNFTPYKLNSHSFKIHRSTKITMHTF